MDGIFLFSGVLDVSGLDVMLGGGGSGGSVIVVVVFMNGYGYMIVNGGFVGIGVGGGGGRIGIFVFFVGDFYGLYILYGGKGNIVFGVLGIVYVNY